MTARTIREFQWITPTIVQNLVSGIDGATGAVTEYAELIFTAAGRTVLACLHASAGKDWESAYRFAGIPMDPVVIG